MKKILGFVMAVVLALCLGGCGQIVSKADYSFTAQDFVMDYFTNYYSKGEFDSVKIVDKLKVKKFNKIYQNKRIEISGTIERIDKIDNHHHFVTFYVPQGEKLAIGLIVVVRDKNFLYRLKKEDCIKMSCLFEGITEDYGHIDEGGIIVCFHFSDGVLISKL